MEKKITKKMEWHDLAGERTMWMDTSVTESEGAAKLRPPQGAGLRGEEKKSIMRKKQFERKKKTNEKKHEETEETRQERGVGGTGIVGTFLQRA